MKGGGGGCRCFGDSEQQERMRWGIMDTFACVIQLTACGRRLFDRRLFNRQIPQMDVTESERHARLSKCRLNNLSQNKMGKFKHKKIRLVSFATSENKGKPQKSFK